MPRSPNATTREDLETLFAHFALPEADWATALPVVPAGVPSTVLTRRPDVSSAQRAMQAAQARVGIANKAWFPTLSLTASGGYASPLRPPQIWNEPEVFCRCCAYESQSY